MFLFGWDKLEFQIRERLLKDYFNRSSVEGKFNKKGFPCSFYQFGLDKFQGIKATLQEENFNCSHIFITTITIFTNLTIEHKFIIKSLSENN